MEKDATEDQRAETRERIIERGRSSLRDLHQRIQQTLRELNLGTEEADDAWTAVFDVPPASVTTPDPTGDRDSPTGHPPAEQPQPEQPGRHDWRGTFRKNWPR